MAVKEMNKKIVKMVFTMECEDCGEVFTNTAMQKHKWKADAKQSKQIYISVKCTNCKHQNIPFAWKL